MNDGIVNTAARSQEREERRYYGVTSAVVVAIDSFLSTGQVQIRIPWLSGFQPWARVAVLMAGPEAGTFFIPQVDDEVLVAFAHGDVREPYVIGSLWNGQDSPPTSNPLDALNKRIVKTPNELTIELDDLLDSITIKNKAGHEVVIGKEQATVTVGQSKMELKKDGRINIDADVEILLSSSKIRLDADNIELKSSATTKVNGGRNCEIRANVVRIN